MTKQKRMYRPSRLLFVAGWMATFLVALFVSSLINPGPSPLYSLYSALQPLLFAGILAITQFLWLRWSFGIRLRSWLPLALAGVLVGELAFQVFEAIVVVYPFPPKLYSGSIVAMPEPGHIMQLKYTLYHTARWFMLWSIPLIFQWLALRKRFRGHGLWLAGAIIHAPLSFVVTEYGGILTGVLKQIDRFAEISLIRDAQPLGSIAAMLDWTTPTVIMGLALYWLLTQGEKVKTDQVRAHQ